VRNGAVSLSYDQAGFTALQENRMRRAVTLITLILLASILNALVAVVYEIRAQDNTQEETYHNDVLGLTFQYPAGWVVREQLSTRTVMAASKDDIDAIAKGNAPAGLLFTVTISSFRLIGAQNVEDFGPILQNIAQASGVTPDRFQVNGAEGLTLEVEDTAQ